MAKMEWVCKEMPAVSINGKVISKMLHKEQELVRCKDCMYYRKPEFGFTFGDCTYRNAWYPTDKDEFCSKGKKKD